MTDQVITTDDGVRLHARVDGEPGAPALLLLNSLGTDLSMWDPQVDLWGGRRRIIRFDQRGHGRSDAPPAPYRVERLGRDALTVLDAYEVDRADICGLSLGGVVALWLAGTAPERVRRAVFADTAARLGSEQAWRARAATVRAEGMDAIVDLVLARFFSPDFLASGAPAVDALDRTLRESSVVGYSGSCDALATADLTELAGTIRAPSLVIVGSDDAATPPNEAERLHGLLAGSRLVELLGAGHLANLEQPDRFGEVILGFLTEQDGQEITRARVRT